MTSGRVHQALLALLFGAMTAGARGEEPLSLAGDWQFRRDPKDEGTGQRWWSGAFSQSIRLPGALQAQGYGEEVRLDTNWTGQIVDRSFFEEPRYAPYREPGKIKVPFWLQPDRHYVGPAWYRRQFEVPEGWRGRRVVLTLERPHWETRVWVDGQALGSRDSLSTPHQYDLGTKLAPGAHTLAIRVDNRLVVDVGVNSHSVSDHTQSNWNGVVGKIELESTPPVWIEDLQVYPEVGTKSIRVRGKIGNATGQEGEGELELKVEGPGAAPVLRKAAQKWGIQGEEFECRIQLGEKAKPWDEFQPALYQLTAALGNGAVTRVKFGLREVGVEGTQFAINGRRLFLRGTLECAIFPLTGHPPMDKEYWKRAILKVAKDHGLNHIRFHSFCPPEAAFEAADELGFYFQVECGSWANQSTTIGDGKPVDEWIYREADQILKAYGNHPSFLLMAYGNEPGGAKHTAFLAKWVDHYKARDGRRLYTAAAGWPQIPENQYHLTPDPRIQGWGQGLGSRINGKPPETSTDYRDYIRQRAVPVVSHEIGQWCVYPNFEEIPLYTGYLKPKNFEVFRDFLDAKGQQGLAKAFLMASGKLQTLCYKEDIESALRTPGMAGFQLLALQDFPGQGTALVGVLDPMWNSKGYVAPEEFRRFCDETVPLARLPRRVYRASETLTAELEAAHFGPAPLAKAVVSWELLGEEDNRVAGGQLPARDVAVGNGIALGSIEVPLKDVPAPARYRLVVGFVGTRFENDWDVWVYPEASPAEPPAGVKATSTLDEAAIKHLDEGGSVLWLVPPEEVKNDPEKPVALGFSSIFWNTAWTQRQPPTTLGILCDPKHNALGGFPTDSHSNWQWWYIVHQAAPMILDGLPRELEPIVRVIDDWFTCRRLGLVIEAKVGKGKLIACSAVLGGEKGSDPVSQQLLSSLHSYMASGDFQPAVSLTMDQLKSLVKQQDAK